MCFTKFIVCVFPKNKNIYEIAFFNDYRSKKLSQSFLLWPFLDIFSQTHKTDGTFVKICYKLCKGYVLCVQTFS